jgi:Uma2 family endonuclease
MSLGYSQRMRAVMLEVPEELLEDRRRRNADRRDEVWEGVLHMVPQPTTTHVRIQAALRDALKQIIAPRGLEAWTELGIRDLADPQSYRVPDVSVTRAEFLSERGIEGRAELVIEVLSPNDESREKLPFYARQEVQEVWLIDPKTRAIEVFALRLDHYEPVGAKDGVIRAPSLGLELEVIAGPRLRIRSGSDTFDV